MFESSDPMRFWPKVASHSQQVAMDKIVRFRMAKAYRRWSTIYRQAKDLNSHGQRVIRHMLNGKMTQAFNTWQIITMSLMRAQSLVYNALKRMQHLHMSTALNSWQSWYTESMVGKSLLSRALSALRHASLKEAINKWIFERISGLEFQRISNRGVSCFIKKMLRRG